MIYILQIYKISISWFDALLSHAEELLELRQPVVLGGDFNVILRDDDVYNPDDFRKNALFREEVKQKLCVLQNLGFYDAFRALHPTKNGYTFWDYAGASLHNDWGMRIDYLWLNAYGVDRLENCEVNKKPRMGQKPSDHTVLQAVLK